MTKTVQALQVKVPESFIDPKDFSQFEGVGNIAGKVVSVDDIIGGAGAQPEVALADLENAPGDSAVLVIGVATKVSVEELESRVSFAANSMKFAVGLATSVDSADEVLADWWSNDGAFKQMFGNPQWPDMWETCESEDGRKAGGR